MRRSGQSLYKRQKTVFPISFFDLLFFDGRKNDETALESQRWPQPEVQTRLRGTPGRGRVRRASKKVSSDKSTMITSTRENYAWNHLKYSKSANVQCNARWTTWHGPTPALLRLPAATGQTVKARRGQRQLGPSFPRRPRQFASSTRGRGQVGITNGGCVLACGMR